MSSKKPQVSYTFTFGDRFAENKSVTVDEKENVQIAKYALLMFLKIAKVLKPEDASRGRMKITLGDRTLVEDMLVTDAREGKSVTIDYIQRYSRKHKIGTNVLISFYIPVEESPSE